MTKAIDDVLAERQRQQSIEGWTPEHDDAHKGGELSRAAGSYAINAGAALFFNGGSDTCLKESMASEGGRVSKSAEWERCVEH